ncbi:MAG TPA: hypothetical protein VLJ59_17865 [Mycobacteriales bacterium]|nr:hypothetical protein [Mycobacteriales bacterium]
MAEAQPIRIPVEISRPTRVFDLVVRGYDRRQVDDHIIRLEQELAEVVWQHDVLESERHQVRAGLADLDRQRAEWEERKATWQPSFAELGERVSTILSLAQQEAEQFRTRTAREHADEHRRAEREIAAARETFEHEMAESRAGLRRDLDLMRREAEAAAVQIVHTARSEADALVEAARHEADGIRIRAQEMLAAARQERARVVHQLGELTDRLKAAQNFLAEAGEPLAPPAPAGPTGPTGTAGPADTAGRAAPAPARPRAVVHIDAMDD